MASLEKTQTKRAPILQEAGGCWAAGSQAVVSTRYCVALRSTEYIVTERTRPPVFCGETILMILRYGIYKIHTLPVLSWGPGAYCVVGPSGSNGPTSAKPRRYSGAEVPRSSDVDRCGRWVRFRMDELCGAWAARQKTVMSL